jgi:3-phytase
MNKLSKLAFLACAVAISNTACGQSQVRNSKGFTIPGSTAPEIKPVVVTEPVLYDTDDPAIWINPPIRLKALL